MSINYPVAGIIILALIILVYFLIKRNLKDEKKLEKELNQPDDIRVNTPSEDSEKD